MNIAKIILICVLLIVLFIIGIVLYYMYRQPKCGNNVDPSQYQCSIIGKPTRIQTKKCNNNNSKQNSLMDIINFLGYMKKIHKKQEKMTLITTELNWKSEDEEPYEMIIGTFYFAIDALLNLLPTDFGQNKETPYGITSFFYPGFSCIQDNELFCSNLLKGTDNDYIKSLCKYYIHTQQIKYNDKCPFLLTTQSPDVDILDPYLYTNLGLLGAIPLEINDVIVIYTHIPVSSLQLNYWSFNIYLADHVKPNEKCYPFRQISASSLCPPLNLFNCYSDSYSWTDYNPFLLDHVNIFIVISLNKNLIKRTKEVIGERYKDEMKNIVVHGFEIPSEPGMNIQSNLPNPNGLTEESVYFNEKYDRLVMFLRLSQFPDADSEILKDYIYQNRNEKSDFQTVLYKFKETTNIQRCSFVSFPKMTHPLINEVKYKSTEFKSMFDDIFSQIKKINEYHIINKTIMCHNSILNIFAPLYKNIKNSDIPYIDGFQAFQMAGNAQADNHDAQYRTSKTTCLSSNDVFLAFCINHSKLHNCIYNNINLINYTRSLSIFSTTLDYNSPYSYYIVICSRSSILIDIIKSKLSLPDDCKIITYLIPNDITYCNPFLFVERVYINTFIDSSLDLFEVYGSDLKKSRPFLDNYEIDTLSKTCGPNNSNLLKPIYMHLSFNKPLFYYSGILALFILLFILVIILFIYKLKFSI